MDYLGVVAFVAAFVTFVCIARAIGLTAGMDKNDREAQRQAELDRRGEAALEALRELGRKYSRPKDY